MRPIWKKCECGSPVCDTWYIANFGTFYQGTGFKPEDKERINAAFDALEEKKMTKYLLKIRDRSGRDFSNVLSFNKEETREKKAREMLVADGAETFELEELMEQLERGEEVIFEATEYEYLIQYDKGEASD